MGMRALLFIVKKHYQHSHKTDTITQTAKLQNMNMANTLDLQALSTQEATTSTTKTTQKRNGARNLCGIHLTAKSKKLKNDHPRKRHPLLPLPPRPNANQNPIPNPNPPPPKPENIDWRASSLPAQNPTIP